ncbi:MAG: DUF4142 domain-containing protein [Novosphingobium sp.]
MNPRTLTILTAATVLGLTTGGCKKQEPPMDAASDSAVNLPYTESTASDAGMAAGGATLAADSHGAMFLADAMKGDNGEVRLGQLAVDQGGSDAVKKFGQMLVTDHGKHGSDVAALASTMGVARTDATSADSDAAYARLKELKGGAFDAAFKEVAVKDHQKDISKYQAEASSKDPKALTDMANQTLPTLKKHLAVAQGL